MTTVTFEAATVADAVKRAARIAPGKAGHAFDKAAGILFEIYPNEETKCIIRATNLDAFHSEVIGVVSAEGDPAVWRLSSRLMDAVVGGLPMKSGLLVKFEQDGSKIRISSGRMKSTAMLMDESLYPEWDFFDEEDLTMVDSLGKRVSMVDWAASTDNVPPMCGVYLDGEWAVATDRYKLARIPCKMKLDKSVIIPSRVVGQTLKQMGEVGIKVDDKQLMIAPDAYSQLKLLTYDVQYSPVHKVFAMEFEKSAEVNKSEFLAKINQACSYSGAERDPVLVTYWGKGEIAVMMENPEEGMFGDVVTALNGLDHGRIIMRFSPKYLLDALNNSPEARIKLFYSPSEEGQKQPCIKIDGGGGLEVWVMKRQGSKPQV